MKFNGAFSLMFSSCFFRFEAQGKELHMLEYGAVPFCSSVKCAKTNGQVFYSAAQVALPGDSVLIEPRLSYYYIPPNIDQATGKPKTINSKQNLTIEMMGMMILHDDTSAWPMNLDNESFVNAFHFINCSGLTIQGGGTIQGQGEVWWREFMFGKIVRERPTMIYIENSNYTTIQNMTMLNSPRFNIYAYDVEYFEVMFCTIWVSPDIQRNIYEELTGMDLKSVLPPFGTLKQFDPLQMQKVDVEALFATFPFNTDGIDFHGRFVHLHDLNISNYDDVVAVKASNANSDRIACTENALIERIEIFTGVGLSIGSVPPGYPSRCVRNITFRHVKAHYPIKVLYVKTGYASNTSNLLSAVIENIVYENISASFSLLSPIYIGPQQQKEPDGTGQGFLGVDTEPRVSIRNITMRDISIENNVMNAGLLRCNASNPCTGVVLENVQVKNLPLSTFSGFEIAFVCDEPDNMYGTFDDVSYPDPSTCVDDSNQ